MIRTFAIAGTLIVASATQAAPQTKPEAPPVSTPKPISKSDFIKNIDTRFNAMDTNHDGKLSREEMAAEQQKELSMATQRLRQATEVKFRQLDTNHDGVLSLQEFMALAPPIHATETADQMLQRLDTNHDGKISPEEFRAPDVAKFDAADTNHDGIVSPAEALAYARAHAH